MRGVDDDLGVGHVVQGRDQAVLDADPLVEDLDHGARQLVVQDAAVRMSCRASSAGSSLTPTTTFSAPCSLTGAATMTLRTPRSK